MARIPDDPTKAQVWVTKGLDDLDFEFYFPQGPKGDPGPFVATDILGTSGINLNDLITPGIYSLSIPSASTDSALRNYPMHEAGSMWVTSSNGGSVVIQQYMTNTKGMYVRRRFSGNWSTWRFFGSSRTDQTAGRAQYHWDELNQREQLIYGDTGNRSVPLENGYGGTLILRRMGSMVNMYGTITRPPGGSLNGIFLSVIPAGFQPTSQAWTYFPVRHSGSSAMFSIYRKANELNITDSATDSDSNQLRFEINWQTTQAWPTSLPGTAVGSPPAT